MATNWADLEIRISTADSINQLKSVIKELTGVRNEAKYFGEEFERAEGHLHTLNNRLKDVTHGSLSNLGQAFRSNTLVAMNFGRVMQDLPFGLMAIANNIDPLVMSLQSLQAEAKAAGVTMGSALVSSLTGPGGMLAALGLVSVAMTLLGQRMRGAGEDAKSLKADLNQLAYELGMIDYRTRALFLLDELKRARDARVAEENKPQYPVGPGVKAAALVNLLWPSHYADPKALDAAWKAELKARQIYEQFSLNMVSPRSIMPWQMGDQGTDREGRPIIPPASSPMLFDQFGRPRSGIPTNDLVIGGYPNAMYGQPGAQLFTAPRMPYGPETSQMQGLVRGLGFGDKMQANAWTSGIQALEVGVASVANSIRTSVGAAWEQVFGRANSLLEIFAQNVLSTFAGLFAETVADLIMSNIPIFGDLYKASRRGKFSVEPSKVRRRQDNLASRYSI